ncbi:Peroxisome membrane protein Pex16 [Penicillium malachiteum]|uniref:Peroxisomal membrane protein PEX16 n=1 Tax=Penicillium malachiteum TaxID=1324776 RepID=A0AAD6MZW2_9EURO|nr:Peroxisome membrane protein Pex16 [Penicillium malachiteum]
MYDVAANNRGPEPRLTVLAARDLLTSRSHAIALLHLDMETVGTIQNPISPAMLQPSKWLSLYEDFVTKNSSSVGQVESALRSLTYIIPGE